METMPHQDSYLRSGINLAQRLMGYLHYLDCSFLIKKTAQKGASNQNVCISATEAGNKSISQLHLVVLRATPQNIASLRYIRDWWMWKGLI
jgi:hypothetical protein